MKRMNLGGEEIEYALKTNPRARRLTLAMRPDGRLLLTKPKYASDRIAEEFIFKNAAWVMRKLEMFRQNPFRTLDLNFSEHKDGALMSVRKRTEELNGAYGFSYKDLKVRDQKTRWGSCSKKGNLNFNFKIIFLPPRLRDYIIVHELCHLKEFNHSPRFWKLVARTFPDHLSLRKTLKTFFI